jgi:hypothetical protein
VWQYTNVEVRIGNGYTGWPNHAPFNKMMVTAACLQKVAALRACAASLLLMASTVMQLAHRVIRLARAATVSIKMVTLAGLEPATSPAPARTRTLYCPLSYSAFIMLMTVCGGARADNRAPG